MNSLFMDNIGLLDLNEDVTEAKDLYYVAKDPII